MEEMVCVTPVEYLTPVAAEAMRELDGPMIPGIMVTEGPVQVMLQVTVVLEEPMDVHQEVNFHNLIVSQPTIMVEELMIIHVAETEAISLRGLTIIHAMTDGSNLRNQPVITDMSSLVNNKLHVTNNLVTNSLARNNHVRSNPGMSRQEILLQETPQEEVVQPIALLREGVVIPPTAVLPGEEDRIVLLPEEEALRLAVLREEEVAPIVAAVAEAMVGVTPVADVDAGSLQPEAFNKHVLINFKN